MFDLAVVGSGFGGSLTAMIGRRLGYSVALIERGRHPRFAIGESSTPLTNLLLEELADRYDLPRLRPLSKWGSWQREYPQIGCGLKRGFTFYHHEFGQEWSPRPGRENELLVAASPNDTLADTHWYRPDFDAFLTQEAKDLGVEFWDETNVAEFRETDSDVRLSGSRLGNPFECQARFLVDATGPRGFLWKTLRLEERAFETYPATQTLYSHFRGVERWDRRRIASENPPYPPDDAALHHVFPGGWMWVLRFNNGITSAGVSVSESLASELNLAEGAKGWVRLLAQLPAVADQFRQAQPIREFTFQERLSFGSATLVGSRWAMLPSAAGFVDPLLSTGFPLTLLGIERLAQMLARHPVPPSSELRVYADETLGDLECAAELVGALHQNLGRPAVFQALGMLYFAAASYAESARRLGRPTLASGFLLRSRPEFREALRHLTTWSRNPSVNLKDFEAKVASAIEPVNVAGLHLPKKRNWYGVHWNDLVLAQEKLGATEAELEHLRIRLGIPA